MIRLKGLFVDAPGACNEIVMGSRMLVRRKILRKVLAGALLGALISVSAADSQQNKPATTSEWEKLLDAARKEAEYYLTKKRTSKETAAMVEHIERVKMLRHAHVG